jgi:hypothetical protein
LISATVRRHPQGRAEKGLHAEHRRGSEETSGSPIQKRQPPF